MTSDSKQEFTPGPWAVSLNIFVDNGLFPAVVDHLDLVVCGVLDDGKTVAETVANSRLIAAAPEMYEALLNVQKLIAEAAMVGFNHTASDWPDRLFYSQQKTSAAIRKASGASS